MTLVLKEEEASSFDFAIEMFLAARFLAAATGPVITELSVKVILARFLEGMMFEKRTGRCMVGFVKESKNVR